MNRCNYIALDASDYPFFDDLLDLDILCTEEGIIINLPEEE